MSLKRVDQQQEIVRREERAATLKTLVVATVLVAGAWAARTLWKKFRSERTKP